jgi:hypothetical protein
MAPSDPSATAPLVLLVDDEPQMRRFLRATLPHAASVSWRRRRVKTR